MKFFFLSHFKRSHTFSNSLDQSTDKIQAPSGPRPRPASTMLTDKPTRRSVTYSHPAAAATDVALAAHVLDSEVKSITSTSTNRSSSMGRTLRINLDRLHANPEAVKSRTQVDNITYKREGKEEPGKTRHRFPLLRKAGSKKEGAKGKVSPNAQEEYIGRVGVTSPEGTPSPVLGKSLPDLTARLASKPLPMDPSASLGQMTGDFAQFHIETPQSVGKSSHPFRSESPLPALPTSQPDPLEPHTTFQPSLLPSRSSPYVQLSNTSHNNNVTLHESSSRPKSHRNSGHTVSQWTDMADYATLISAKNPAELDVGIGSLHQQPRHDQMADMIVDDDNVSPIDPQERRPKVAFRSPAASMALTPETTIGCVQQAQASQPSDDSDSQDESTSHKAIVPERSFFRPQSLPARSASEVAPQLPPKILRIASDSNSRLNETEIDTQNCFPRDPSSSSTIASLGRAMGRQHKRARLGAAISSWDSECGSEAGDQVSQIRGMQRPSSPSVLSGRGTPASPNSPPFETSPTDTTQTARLPAVRLSWAQKTEEDLVANLSPRERTRQEVLWEIVSSEDRYVSDLLKLKSIFADALLPSNQDRLEIPYHLPDPTSPLSSTRMESISSIGSSSHPAQRTSPSNVSLAGFYTRDSAETGGRLPIAARFASPRPSSAEFGDSDMQSGGQIPALPAPHQDRSELIRATNTTESPVIGLGFDLPAQLDAPDGGNRSPRSTAPYGIVTNSRPGWQSRFARPGRSHHSLPPLPRNNPTSPLMPNLSSTFNSRAPVHVTSGQPVRKVSSGSSAHPNCLPTTHMQMSLSKRLHKQPPFNSGSAKLLEKVELPDNLAFLLETISSTILEGHLALRQALNSRYDDQYPLVRTLCDVFIAHSSIFSHYKEYILHLEAALAEVDELPFQPRHNRRESLDSLDPKAVSQRRQLAQILAALDGLAAAQGETGLFISLSKPFQRLLRYPLLFQNLLYHTDPSTKEYEATVNIIQEIESIVRGIEDEKWSQEQLQKTRDVLARIEGLDKNKLLVAPNPSRVLVDEKPYQKPVAPVQSGDRRSHKRLSDLFHRDPESKLDLWAVTFFDVTLLCSKVGSTTLPLGTQNNFGPGAVKSSTVGRRSRQITPRNLYHFQRILGWRNPEQPPHSEDNKQIIETSRSSVTLDTSVGSKNKGHREEENSSDSDDASRISFAVTGQDQLSPLFTEIPPVVQLQEPTAGSGSQRNGKTRFPSNFSSSTLPLPSTKSKTNVHQKISADVANSDAKFGHRLRASSDGPNIVSRSIPKTSTLTATTASQRAIMKTKPTTIAFENRTQQALRSKTNTPIRPTSPSSIPPPISALASRGGAFKKPYLPKAPGKRI